MVPRSSCCSAPADAAARSCCGSLNDIHITQGGNARTVWLCPYFVTCTRLLNFPARVHLRYQKPEKQNKNENHRTLLLLLLLPLLCLEMNRSLRILPFISDQVHACPLIGTSHISAQRYISSDEKQKKGAAILKLVRDTYIHQNKTPRLLSRFLIRVYDHQYVEGWHCCCWLTICQVLIAHTVYDGIYHTPGGKFRGSENLLTRCVILGGCDIQRTPAIRRVGDTFEI